MPDVLGYDARTIFSKRAQSALAAAGGVVLDRAYHEASKWLGQKSYNISKNLAQGALKRFKRAHNLPTKVSIMPRYGRYTRFRRRWKKSRKYAGRKRGKRWGQKRRIIRGLYNNMSINDYKTIKLSRRIGELTVNDQVPLSNVTRFRVNIDEFINASSGNTFGQEYFDMHEMYKVKHCQIELRPRQFIKTNMNNTTATGELPYLLCKIGPPTNEGTPTNVSMNTVQQTPGMVYVKLGKSRRTVFSQTPLLKLDTTIEVNGTNPEVHRFKKFPWIEKQSIQTEEPDFVNFDVIRPVLASGGESLFWDVYAYVTLQLRQNTNLVPQM